jgi:hypothetical protein
VELLSRNQDLLRPGELDVFERFKRHQEAFEYNHLSGNKSAAAPLFPTDMNRLLADDQPDA